MNDEPAMDASRTPTNVEIYKLNEQDKALLQTASVLLRKIAVAEFTKPAELLSVAKVQHVLSRLPRVTHNVTVAVSIQSPRRKFASVETWHWWDVCVADCEISFSSGGHLHRPSTGGDSFTTMNWTVSPGDAPNLDDYLESLSIVPDIQSFPDAVRTMDFAAEAYTLKIDDVDNAFLQDDGEEDSDTEDDSHEDAQAQAEDACTEEFNDRPREPWVVVPVNDSERKLMFMVDNDQIAENEPQFAWDADDCSGCGNALDEYGVFIDGRLRGQLTWVNLCAKCFIHMGEGVGWGKGQLYARQPTGDWRLVAGFRPDQSV